MTDLQKFLNRKGIKTLPDNKGWTNRIEIFSDTSGNRYIIAQRANLSEWGCSCNGWIYHRHCYHLNTLLPLLVKVTKSLKRKKV